MFKTKLIIDFGSQNLRIYDKNGVKVLEEPTVVLYEGSRAVAFGSEVYSVARSNPKNLVAVCPIKEGRISNARVAREYLSVMLSKSMGKASRASTMLLVLVSAGLSALERKEISDVFSALRYSNTRYIEGCLAIAALTGEPVSVIVDIGAELADVALTSRGNVVTAYSLNAGGQLLDLALKNYTEDKYGVSISYATAEAAKRTIGTIFMDTMHPVPAVGTDSRGVAVNVELTSADLFEAFSPVLQKIAEVIRLTLTNIAPEYMTYVSSNGVFAVGGAFATDGVAEYLSEQVGVRFTKLPDLHCSAGKGAAEIIA